MILAECPTHDFQSTLNLLDQAFVPIGGDLSNLPQASKRDFFFITPTMIWSKPRQREHLV
jgi:hypothetical protein